MTKWIIVTLVVLFAGWELAVFIAKKSKSENGAFVSTDSLQARASLPDGVLLDTMQRSVDKIDTTLQTVAPQKGDIDTKGVQPRDVIAFAKTQMDVPYLYGSTDPAKGFDCSGFITYVFNHFGITVPRSSIEFTNVGNEVTTTQAKEGDLILFTGTDSTERFVGHMGIVIDNSDSLRFIHSSSGKASGVTITPLNGYYQSRYVKTIRIFP